MVLARVLRLTVVLLTASHASVVRGPRGSVRQAEIDLDCERTRCLVALPEVLV